MKKKVLIMQRISDQAIDRLRHYGWEVAFSTSLERETLVREAYDCEALVIRTAPLPGEVLRRLDNLKVIGRHGVGFNNVDIAAADELGIYVANTPGVNATAVAEGTIAMILQLGRKFNILEAAFRADDWKMRDTLPTSEIQGRSLGIIGMGSIGREVARKAICGLDMKVYGYSNRRSGFPEGVIACESADEVFRTADFVSIHIPAGSRPFVTARELALMKPEAYLINTSRGAVIDESALIEALRQGRIAGAGLDVFEEEPPRPDNPLLHMENVVVLPHVTGLTEQSNIRCGLMTADNIEQIINGERPRSIVNHPVRPRI